jgi:hypothetical protein
MCWHCDGNSNAAWDKSDRTDTVGGSKTSFVHP